MSRLTMQEVIEHCERTAKDMEKTHERYRKWLELEPMPIHVKRYYEHKQTAEWLKELQHYKDLEEQGRLIELPCKVGEEVWTVHKYWGIQHATYYATDRILLDMLNGHVFVKTKEEAQAKWKEFRREKQAELKGTEDEI